MDYTRMFNSLNIKEKQFWLLYIIRKKSISMSIFVNLESPKKKRHEVIFDELSCTSVKKKRHKILITTSVKKSLTTKPELHLNVLFFKH